MTFKLLSPECVSFRCDDCSLVVASSAVRRELWQTLSNEGWIEEGERHVCARCQPQLRSVG
jgi:hypothetical protein